MDGDELAFAGVARQAELLRDGQVSARELAELCLERIERLDPELNAFRRVMAERAVADADQADARRRAGEERPLLGVPLAVKDTQDVAGEVTAHGTDAHGEPAREDSAIVGRLRAAGVVIVGKTNLPELAIIGSTEGPAFGVTRNPWDVERTPGGSSGGSAAAVAAGLVPAATGSDGAGSIRIPAANCGLFGLKPQRDRISLAPDREHWHGLSVLGFETRGVADTALLLDCTAERPPKRPYREAAASPPGRLRIAVSTRAAFPAPPPHRAVREALDETTDALRSLGHAVVRRDPDYGLAATTVGVRYFSGICDDAISMPRPHRLQRRTRGFARIGRLIPAPVLRWAREREAAYSARINRIFDEVDVLMTPTVGRPPVGAAEWEGLGALRTFLGMARPYPYTGVWNMTGQPAAAVPAGITDGGLPLSVQLIAPPDGEPRLLSLAAQLERERPWGDRRPPVS